MAFVTVTDATTAVPAGRRSVVSTITGDAALEARAASAERVLVTDCV
jgi:hypothetical protein